jgi:CRP/FNR family transcriptional regulator
MNAIAHEGAPWSSKEFEANGNFKLVAPNLGLPGRCKPDELSPDLLELLGGFALTKSLKSGTALYQIDDQFHSLYVLKSGFIKQEVLHDSCQLQVTGFFMRGELFGFDGVVTKAHLCNAIAIEDSVVFSIPFEQLESLAHKHMELQRYLFLIMCGETVRNHQVMMMLGRMQGEQRMASFLLNLSLRLHDQGYSPRDLVLRMKRHEIGSYLGMTLETVSRILSKFQHSGLLLVNQKNICILDLDGLRNVLKKHNKYEEAERLLSRMGVELTRQTA